MKTFKSFYIEQQIGQDISKLQQQVEAKVKELGQPVVMTKLLNDKLQQYKVHSLEAFIEKLEQEPKVRDFVHAYKQAQKNISQVQVESVLEENWIGDILKGISNVFIGVFKWFINSVLDTVKHVLGPIFGMGGASTTSKFKYVMMLMLTLGMPLSLFGLMSIAGSASALPIGVKAYGAAWAFTIWFGDQFLQPLLMKVEGVPPEAKFM